MEFFFATFGYNSSLRNCYMRLIAEDKSAAHELMRETYGDRWAFLYDEEEFEGQVDKYRLAEVPFGTPNAAWPIEERMQGKTREWIDNASFVELLYKMRFESIGSTWFAGEAGEYLMKVYKEKRNKLTDAEFTQISKRVGWERS